VTGVIDAAVFGSGVHVVVQDAARAGPAIRQALESQNIHVHRIEPISPSLEDVFVTLTSPAPGATKVAA